MNLIYAVATFATILAGAMARRHVGGWMPSDRPTSAGICVLVAFLASWVAMGTHHPLLIAFSTAMLGLLWWIQQGHGWAQGMGSEANYAYPIEGGKALKTSWPFGTPCPAGGPTNLCVAIFFGNYTSIMMLVGVVWALNTNDEAGLYYALFGLLTPLPHLLAQELANILPVKPNTLLDAPTAYGELGLGAIVYGGLPLAAWMAL